MAGAVWVAVGASVLTAAAAVAFYLAAPQQQWLRAPWPVWTRGLALACGVAALLLWPLQASTAFFTLLTLLMAAFVALPFLGAALHLLRARR